MFGFDKMFDFDRDGKLDSWERAAQCMFSVNTPDIAATDGGCFCLNQNLSMSRYRNFKIL